MSKVTKTLALDLALRLDVASSTVTYLGNAVEGTATSSALWQIKRLTSTSAGNLTIEYPAGSSSYINIWNNRASLSYS